jgi:hypothetical protein
METNTMVLLARASTTDMGSLHGQVEITIKDNIVKARDRDLEY